MQNRLWVGRIMSGLAVLFLLFDSVIHMMKIAPVVDGFAQLGYPVSLAFGLGVLEQVEQLVVAVVRIDRHDGDAEGVEGEEVEEELGAILEEESHPMAVTIAGRPIYLSQPQTGLVRLLVGELDSVGMVIASGSRRCAEE